MLTYIFTKNCPQDGALTCVMSIHSHAIGMTDNLTFHGVRANLKSPEDARIIMDGLIESMLYKEWLMVYCGPPLVDYNEFDA